MLTFSAVVLGTLIWMENIVSLSPARGCEAPKVISQPSQESIHPYQVVKRYPHDKQAFTQGLVFKEGDLYESTGLYGHSSLRKVELGTGRVLALRRLDPQVFGEGLTVVKGRLMQLTWQAEKALIYRPNSLQPTGKLRYHGEGWGLTTVGDQLVMSNGTNVLVWRNPDTFVIEKSRRIRVREHPLQGLNELEYVKSKILANVWPGDCIAEIDPQSGQVTGWLDLNGLYPAASRRDDADVLNGIAYDPENDYLYVTGKRWPYLYQLAVDWKANHQKKIFKSDSM
ncbi:glutaminyl-peptide cyclotransferase [Methylohalobius crimeensis]|uniref:glutaminyl-peptide cyclotransferase n=1 Tax=Methylohalobius crimeensis TaxID=244365 RepID=UPI0003B34A02|nr:glutaminyl-peptide cyclotransferase [Methylohalobius crimeensis]